ncbi:MAG: hypothetical protein E7461_01205 [Ruminococcaceae bacterium]|nr:hypothetical protein [Oscillospiraceae bacterium]
MDMVKKYFPFSFGLADVKKLVISILIYVVIGVVSGIVCGILGIVPLLGDIAAWVVGTVSGIYTTVGIVLSVLSFLKVIQ